MVLPQDRGGLRVSINGELVDAASAAISVWDHGFLYGDGVFEGMRVRNRLLYQPDAHMARLSASARTVGIALPARPDAIIASICALVVENGLDDCYVRLVITRGSGAPGLDPTTCGSASCVILAYPQAPSLGTAPLRLLTSSVVRKAPRSIGAHVKSLNYLDSVLAKLQAKQAGMDDALMLDGNGYLAEATGANVFLVFADALHTPSTIAALPGITRRAVIELARERSVAVVERDIGAMEVYAADEIFLSGTGAGLVAVGAIDGRVFAAERPVFDNLREAYECDTHDPRRCVAIDAVVRPV